MGRMMILNGSPRAAKSNSKLYAQILKKHYPGATLEYSLNSQNHRDICSALESCSNLCFVFPLYVDCLPTCMLEFLNCLAKSPLNHKPTVQVIINCGFLEPKQNALAIDIIREFCKENGFPFGSSLSIGGGEAILKTPLSFLVKRAIQKFAHAVYSGKAVTLSVTMPLSKNWFIEAARRYWLSLAAPYHLTQDKLAPMEIEPKPKQ